MLAVCTLGQKPNQGLKLTSTSPAAYSINTALSSVLNRVAKKLSVVRVEVVGWWVGEGEGGEVGGGAAIHFGGVI